MIALRAPASTRITKAHNSLFLSLLPAIQQQAQKAFRFEEPEQREEMVQAAIALAYAMFARMVRQAKTDLAFATPLASYAIRQVRAGRQLGTKLNCNDVSARYAQRFHGLSLERLDQADRGSGEWQEALVEDRRAGPAETAIARIDFSTWLRSLPTKLRRVAKLLASGESTAEVARRFQLTAGRVSQLRRELMRSWEHFQGSLAAPADSFCAA